MSIDFTSEFEKSQDKTTEAERAKEEKEASQPSLTEVLADDEKSRFFLIYLEEQDEQELATKLHVGKLEAEDRAALEGKRLVFLDRLEKAQKLQDSLGGDLENMIKASPELKQEAKTAGIDVLRKVLVDKAINRSFRDPSWMENMSKKVESREATKKAIIENNELISEYCKKYNIKEEEFTATLPVDGTGAPDALKQLIKDKMAFLQRVFTSDREVMGMVDKIDQRETMKNNLTAVAKDLNELGVALRETLLGDSQAKEALAAYITGENPPKTERSFEESKAALRGYEIQDKEASTLQGEWNKKKAENEKNKSFDIDNAYASFIEDATENSFQSKAGKGKRGFWATIFKIIVGHKLEGKIEK